MKLFATDSFTFPLPEGHRFPVSKYRLLRRRALESGLFAPEDVIVPHAATDEELLRVHCADYLRKLREGTLSDTEQRRIGLPWSPELVERSRRTVGATIEACRSALAEGVAASLAGGTHHAFRDAGEGFCVFNDCATAARAMQAEGRVGRVVIIDLDVHQGNGTAAIFRGDDSVFTFSVHGARNFPLRKERGDLDVELPDGTGDVAYLEAVEQGVWEALHRARADLALYLAGADPFEGDRLGRMKVTMAGLARRNELVLEACARERLPLAMTMAGGYGHDINDTVDVYWQNVWQAHQWWRRWQGRD
jgi:acetoin utilization deacetylase AcuC-like enzyme